MCGIIGYLDKRGGPDRPVGRTLLTMLQALSCRGPDSAGVAVLGAPSAFWVLQVKLPEHADPEQSGPAMLDVVRDSAAVLRHQRQGAYLRLEVEGTAEPAALERQLLTRFPEAEVVSLGHALAVFKQLH
jgi:amidophosphoribosyltransferase